MEFQKTTKRISTFRYYFWQFLCLIPIVVTLHYCKTEFLKKIFDFRYNTQTYLNTLDLTEDQCKKLFCQSLLLQKELNDIREELNEIRAWRKDTLANLERKLNDAFDTFYSDHVGMFDYASEYAGGSIISTADTIPYQFKFDGFRFFGTIDWMFESQPNTVLQTAQPGKCYAFRGDKGRIVIKLGRPVAITHVSLEHIRIGEGGKSAPKDFQILGFHYGSVEEDLGSFVYDLSAKIIQTFRVPPRNRTFDSVELRILSNHGNEELTCVYRIRVHSSLISN